MKARWTTWDEVVGVLEKRWARGSALRSYAARDPFVPITLPIRGPSASEFLERFDDAVQWAERFRRGSHTPSGRSLLTVEYRTVKGRGLGANDIPARVLADTFPQLVALLGVEEEVEALDAVLALTEEEIPGLRPWVAAHPQEAIAHRAVWRHVLATIRWIADQDPASVYLRQVDVPGVDTKFIERHSRILDQLLMTVLSPDRVDLTQAGLARRYGFRRKPNYVRFRILDPLEPFPPGLSELRLRAGELADLKLDVGTVFIVENEISYLAFPDVPDALVIFGEGFAATVLEGIPWLDEKHLVYWGDIDTHGFAILDRLRSRFRSVASILMDHATLLAHPDQHVREENPTSAPLVHLTAAEQSLYHDLVEDRFGTAVRLEQERVRFGLVRRALDRWASNAATPPP